MPRNSTEGKYTVGQKIGHWTLLEAPKNKRHMILCQCDCGKKRRGKAEHIIDGASIQCRSCASRITHTKHGCAPRSGRTRLFTIWGGMKNRCKKQFSHAHIYYNRGIKICPEWENDFSSFRDWALCNGYQNNLTLDRRDNDKGYNPDNCRWVTQKTQARNKRNLKLVEAFGEAKFIVDWSKDARCIVKLDALSARLRKKWPPELALTTPSDTIKNRKIKWSTTH